jgi:4-hydroxybenzoate polyprenyltransferase
MAARLGKVLYWAGCVLAALIIAIGVVLSSVTRAEQDWWALIVAFVVALLVWLTGRACRYVLAGN